MLPLHQWCWYCTCRFHWFQIINTLFIWPNAYELFIVSLVQPFVAEFRPHANSFRIMGDQHNGCMSRVCRLETLKRYIALFIRTPRSGCGNIPWSRHSHSCHWILTLPLCRDHVTHRSGKRFKIDTFVLLLVVDFSLHKISFRYYKLCCTGGSSYFERSTTIGFVRLHRTHDWIKSFTRSKSTWAAASRDSGRPACNIIWMIYSRR